MSDSPLRFIAGTACVLGLIWALNTGFDAAQEYGRFQGRVAALENRAAEHERLLLRLTDVLNKVVDRHNERLSALETKIRP